MRGGGLTHLAAHLGGLLIRHVVPEPLGEKGTSAIGPFPDLVRRERLSGYLLHESPQAGATRFSHGGELVTDFGGDTDHDVRHAASIRGVYAPCRGTVKPPQARPSSMSTAIARRTLVRAGPYCCAGRVARRHRNTWPRTPFMASGPGDRSQRTYGSLGRLTPYLPANFQMYGSPSSSAQWTSTDFAFAGIR